MNLKNEMKESDYIKAFRIETINFPKKAACVHCRYFGKKSGLIYEGETPIERYENFVCKLTFEPLPREKISNSIGRLCPLEFEKQKGEKINDR